MIKIKTSTYEMYTSKQGIEYMVKNMGGKLKMIKMHSCWGIKILPASKEIKSIFIAA
jgi:hypothetical protein